MSSEPAIRVEKMGKRYALGSRGGYHTVRESLARAASGLLSTLNRRGTRLSPPGHVWALRDVSFEIQPGEVVGVVGANGAGKSTLLKILSRITRPTEGIAELRGRLGCLLEVGTGFHPELTGRENVFLNGVILGLGRREIRDRFDEIVDFAGIETKFLDTPVKRYSSGMQLRLAFAVAAHLRTDVLLVDEVLAVGDAEFQRRCLKKVEDLASTQRTVLLVSHNMVAIHNLCERALYFRGGELVYDGAAADAVRHYLHGASPEADPDDPAFKAPFASLLRWDFRQPDGNPLRPLQPARLRFWVRAIEVLHGAGVMFQLLSSGGELLMALDFRDHATCSGPTAIGQEILFEFQIERLPLIPGTYALQVWLKNRGNEQFEAMGRLIELEVAEAPVYANHSSDVLARHYGPIAMAATANYRLVSSPAESVEPQAAR